MKPFRPPPAKGSWHSQSAEEVLARFGSAATGPSAQAAAKRLATNGPRELKEDKRISPWQIFPGRCKNLILWILIGARSFALEVWRHHRARPGRLPQTSTKSAANCMLPLLVSTLALIVLERVELATQRRRGEIHT
jgi:magnesium-transporting ATPase (P-type)